MTKFTSRPGARRLLVAAGVSASLVAGAVLAPAANAARTPLELGTFSAPILDRNGDEVTQAGAHPFVVKNDMTITEPEMFVPSGSLKEAVVDLPVGFVGNPSDFPTCTDDQLLNLACPPESQIGTFTVTFIGNMDTGAGLYNMSVPKGQAARFGSPIMFATVPVYFDATVRPGDNGVRVASKDVSQLIPIVETHMEMWGVPADPAHDRDRGIDSGNRPVPSPDTPRPYLTTGTSCGVPQVTTVKARGWHTPDVWDAARYEGPALTGCEDLPFSPTATIQPEHTVAGTPAGYTVELTQPLVNTVDDLASSHLKDATVALPDGVTINAGVADGLGACTEEQIGLGTDDAVACPLSSKLGEVTVETPLLDEPLTGGVYQAQQDANPFGSTLALYLAPQSDRYGVKMKLAGEVTTDPVTGRVTTVFKDNPQQPWSKMTLTLKGGDRAVLSNPATCGVKTSDWSLTPWARPEDVVSGTDAFTIDSAPAGGSCANDLFAPTFSAGTISPVAGASSPFSMTFAVGAGQQNVSSVAAELPPGLLGKVGSVPLCPEAQANVGACDVASRVGDVVVGVGGATSPLVVPQAGKAPTAVHMSGPYRGAPFSLSIVVPAQAGPLDLGTVVARVALSVDRKDAHVTARLTDSRVIDRRGQVVQTIEGGMPQIVDGIPLAYRSITVDLNRDGFMVNPTSCDAAAIHAAIWSVAGTAVERASRFQVGGCDALPLKPSLALAFTGGAELGKGKHPGLEANLGTIAGNANVKQVKASLPLAVALDPSNAKALCEPADAEAGRCPETSVIGEAVATTPLLAEPVRGPIHFVKGFRTGANGQRIATLPKLYMTLAGQGIAVDVRADSSVEGPAGKQRLVATFANLPDVPLSDFRLRIAGGANGVLKATADVCAAAKGTKLEFIGQSNAVHRTTVAASATGCRTQIASATSSGTAVSVRVAGIGAGRLRLSGARVRTTSRTIRSADAATVTAKLRLTSAQRQQLRRGRAVRVATQLRFTPVTGKAVTLRRTVTVPAAKRR